MSPFTAAHTSSVKSLYKRMLKNSLDWTIRRDVWREKALEIRAEFERHRNVADPRAISDLISRGEAQLAATLHPDPYIPSAFPGGSKWERNLPPPTTRPVDHRHGH